MCKHFRCLPSAAIGELQHDTEYVAEKIILMRQFIEKVRWYEAWCNNKSKDREPLPDDDEMLDMVIDIEFEIAERAGADDEEE